MLTNPRDAFRGQSRLPNIVLFHMLGIVSSCAIVTLSLWRAVFPIFDFKNVVTLKFGSEVTQGHWKWYHSIDIVWFPISVLNNFVPKKNSLGLQCDCKSTTLRQWTTYVTTTLRPSTTYVTITIRPSTSYVTICVWTAALRPKINRSVCLQLAGQQPLMCHVAVTLMTFDKQSNGRRIVICITF